MTSEDLSDVSAIVERLRELLGDPFVDWVLGQRGGSVTQEQAEIARLLDERINEGLSSSPGLPAALALSPLTYFEPSHGMTWLNFLRLHAGATEYSTVELSGDELLDCLIRAVGDAYGELLLPDHLGTPTSLYSSPNGKRAIVLIRDDPAFPFLVHQSDDERGVQMYASTGRGGGLNTYHVAPSLIKAAWELAKLDEDRPGPDLVRQKLKPLLAQARTAIQKSSSVVTGLASLSGVVLPNDDVIDLGWGDLRPAKQQHHPDFIGRTYAEKRSVRRMEDGSEVVISDAGEVLLRVDVPYKVHFGEMVDDRWPISSVSQDGLHSRSLQVRLAHLLSSKSENPPVLIQTWSRFIEPVAGGTGFGYADPSLFAMRTPTLLASDEVREWVDWIRLLDDIPIKRLGVAPSRIIRACAERRDPFDALIDAVIAWEALFASDTEAVLRVSVSMARLLHAAGSARDATRQRVAKIYRLRSKIVHGVEVDSTEVGESSRVAMRLTIDTLRVLVRDRRDLLTKTSSERSTQLVTE